MAREFDAMSEVPAQRQVIQGYEAGGFTISGVRHEGSVLVLPDETHNWPVAALHEVTLESLQPVLSAEPGVEILLLGAGARFAMASLELRRALQARGIVVESMDTAAACRTFNVLLVENRRVAAALITP